MWGQLVITHRQRHARQIIWLIFFTTLGCHCLLSLKWQNFVNGRVCLNLSQVLSTVWFSVRFYSMPPRNSSVRIFSSEVNTHMVCRLDIIHHHLPPIAIISLHHYYLPPITIISFPSLSSPFHHYHLLPITIIFLSSLSSPSLHCHLPFITIISLPSPSSPSHHYHLPSLSSPSHHYHPPLIVIISLSSLSSPSHSYHLPLITIISLSSLSSPSHHFDQSSSF